MTIFYSYHFSEFVVMWSSDYGFTGIITLGVFRISLSQTRNHPHCDPKEMPRKKFAENSLKFSV